MIIAIKKDISLDIEYDIDNSCEVLSELFKKGDEIFCDLIEQKNNGIDIAFPDGGCIYGIDNSLFDIIEE